MSGPRRPYQAVLLGGLVVGTLDIVYAMAFWGVQGVAPTRILQAVAAGLLGAAAREGGWATALLGAVLHFGIATAMVCAYYVASGGLPSLIRRPIVYGVLYGLFLYLFMNLVVVPLSAAGGPSFEPLLWVVCSIAVHMFLIGVPCALFARLARRLAAGRTLATA